MQNLTLSADPIPKEALSLHVEAWNQEAMSRNCVNLIIVKNSEYIYPLFIGYDVKRKIPNYDILKMIELLKGLPFTEILEIFQYQPSEK